MDVQYFPIDKVLPNPYQMRLSEDEAHVAGLAEDIAANGLLQIPTARPHPKKSGAVELAFGHSRLAAYQRLAANGRGADYSKFPLVIKELNNRQMSDLAASENARRKNLSPIETARAIMRRKKDFKLGNAEAGAPFGLGESAAANLLRLLDLPDDVQTQVDTGELPQRLARQLVNVNRTDPKAAKAIAKAVAKSPAGERDGLLRQLLVAGEILHHVFGYNIDYHVREGRAWAHIREAIKKLATTGLDGAGFGAKLPAGWDKAPVHRTPWNCWHCGAFTGAERVTKRDLAAGWIVRGKEDKPDLVACSAAHEAAFVKSAGKKVVKQ